MEKIYHQGILIGIKLTKFPSGSVPHTDPNEFLGLLTLKHPKGASLKAHVHKPVKREASRLQECFIVKKGKVRIDLYSQEGKFFKFIYLSAGQAFLATNGGHGFHILKDSELFEVKNGPFIEDKVFLEHS